MRRLVNFVEDFGPVAVAQGRRVPGRTRCRAGSAASRCGRRPPSAAEDLGLVGDVHDAHRPLDLLATQSQRAHPCRPTVPTTAAMRGTRRGKTELRRYVASGLAMRDERLHRILDARGHESAGHRDPAPDEPPPSATRENAASACRSGRPRSCRAQSVSSPNHRELVGIGDAPDPGEQRDVVHRRPLVWNASHCASRVAITVCRSMCSCGSPSPGRSRATATRPARPAAPRTLRRAPWRWRCGQARTLPSASATAGLTIGQD